MASLLSANRLEAASEETKSASEVASILDKVFPSSSSSSEKKSSRVLVWVPEVAEKSAQAAATAWARGRRGFEASPDLDALVSTAPKSVGLIVLTGPLSLLPSDELVNDGVELSHGRSRGPGRSELLAKCCEALDEGGALACLVPAASAAEVKETSRALVLSGLAMAEVEVVGEGAGAGKKAGVVWGRRPVAAVTKPVALRRRRRRGGGKKEGAEEEEKKRAVVTISAGAGMDVDMGMEEGGSGADDDAVAAWAALAGGSSVAFLPLLLSLSLYLYLYIYISLIYDLYLSICLPISPKAVMMARARAMRGRWQWRTKPRYLPPLNRWRRRRERLGRTRRRVVPRANLVQTARAEGMLCYVTRYIDYTRLFD